MKDFDEFVASLSDKETMENLAKNIGINVKQLIQERGSDDFTSTADLVGLITNVSVFVSTEVLSLYDQWRTK